MLAVEQAGLARKTWQVQRLCRLVTLLMLCNICNVYAQKPVTAGKVYQETESVLAVIESIRKKLNIKTQPETPPIHSGKQPIHLLSKALELNESLASLQKKYRLPSDYNSKPLPLKPVTLTEVMAATQQAKNGLEAISVHLNAEAPNLKIGWALAKSPSDVYRQLTYATALLHTITGPVSLETVHQHVTEILADQELIANALNTNISKNSIKANELQNNVNEAADQSTTAVAAIDLNIQAHKSLLYTAFLQRKLNMEVFKIPEMNGANFSTADVNDTLHLILVELTRVKMALDIKEPIERAQAQQPNETQTTSPDHIFALLKRSAIRLEALATN